MIETIQPGLYKHFKGGLYRVLGECLYVDATPATVCVLYENAESGARYVRSLEEWIKPVVWFDGETQERFRFISF